MKSKAGRYGLMGIAGVVLIALVAYMGGAFNTGVIEPGHKANAPRAAQTEPKETATAIATQLPEFFQAVGTVRPRTEAVVSAQVGGRVLEVLASAGEQVKKGQTLAVLDTQGLNAKLAQARQGLKGARAALSRAKSEYNRVKKLYDGQAATKRDLEAAEAARLQAMAASRAAAKQVEEAKIATSYGTIKAPAAGQLSARLVEPGDLALPGKPLFKLQTSGAFRLEALLRESLIGKVQLGQVMAVDLPALGKDLSAEIEEISPAADAQSRSFLVKAALDDSEGVFSGMFGRLVVPTGVRDAVLAPMNAIQKVGQLEMVRIKTTQGWRKVFVTTGRRHHGMVEVLSGLKGGEILALEDSDA